MSALRPPCACSRDALVWRLWHSLLKRRGWAALPSKGVRHGLDWRNCPGCDSTLCKAVAP